MAFNNPPMPRSELERIASGRGVPPARPVGDEEAPRSHKREGYQPPQGLRPRADVEAVGARVPYAELHCHSNFSFLDGASHPEQLVEEAARLGLDAVVLADHDGMYGAVRFAEAGRELGIRTGHGAELSLRLSRRKVTGHPSPPWG